MRILITGANGMVGSALRATASSTVDLIALERNELDVTNRAQVDECVDALQPDVIINAAAFTAVDSAESHAADAERVNGVAPGILGAAARRVRAKVIHFSTDYVFDGESEVPYTEEAAPNPVNVYGRTKLQGEHALRQSGALHLIIRTQWLFGPAGKNFPSTMWLRACRGVATRVVDDQFGVPTHANDLARAAWTLLGHEGTLNVVSEGFTTWFGVATRVFARAGASHLLSPCKSGELRTPAKRPLRSVLSAARLAALGVSLPPWDEALDRYLDRLVAEEE
ncbi:MAG: dTDP-4-dehydrorhamnose reductase [Gemmatimonadetes bacterium]|nr:dTDP-4-dehydrorhamnose reductase [Gemmatimonadota bacterium]